MNGKTLNDHFNLSHAHHLLPKYLLMSTRAQSIEFNFASSAVPLLGGRGGTSSRCLPEGSEDRSLIFDSKGAIP